MHKVVLFGATACANEKRLKRILKTRWQLMTVPDEGAIEQLEQNLSHADAIISLFWNRQMAKATSNLKLIQALGAGVDGYDKTALPPGCSLCNVYEHGVPVAEYVIGAMVALSVGFIFHDHQLREGYWDGTGRRDGQPHQELAGKTVGLIGYGSIGREVSKRARAFGMKVQAI
ncbi:MAG: hypothetical protein H0T92_13210, partial [Pyrinomonadaceae bacterium]|nr:hypothetical protein [Pyrinomonadaceae bacterium]